MKNNKENFNENINEVINSGVETDIVFFVQSNNGQFVQKVLPAFLKPSFISRFGQDVPTELEFNIWYAEQQKAFNKNESRDLLLG